MSGNGSMDMNSPSSGLGSSKYGTLVPNRIFVGGISSNTSEAELHALFSKYGNVKATKIIMDKAGISKGYGFVTFETEEEAQRIQKEVDSIVLKDRKLNIAPAIKKQPFARVLADPAQMISSNTILYQGAVPQTFNNAALLAGGDGLYLPQATYPVIYPHVVIPHQYHYQASAGSSYPQYLYTLQTPSDLYSYSGVPHTASHSSEYAESSASEASSEGGKATYSKQNPMPSTVGTDYESNRLPPNKSTRGSCNGGSYRGSTSSVGSNSSTTSSSSNISSHQYHPLANHLHSHLLAKTVNGMAVMAYPSSIVMGTPTILHVRDPNNGEHDTVTELGFLHSTMTTSALTPPPTPLAPVSCDFAPNSANDPARKN